MENTSCLPADRRGFDLRGAMGGGAPQTRVGRRRTATGRRVQARALARQRAAAAQPGRRAVRHWKSPLASTFAVSLVLLVAVGGWLLTDPNTSRSDALKTGGLAGGGGGGGPGPRGRQPPPRA